jgi:hypothetical protein
MGSTTSSNAVTDVKTRLRNFELHVMLLDLRVRLQAAFDAFVEKHCEVSPDVHVSVYEMQSAIVVYMENIAGLQYEVRQWFMYHSEYLFDDFGKGVNGVHVSGVMAHRVLTGIRVRNWPRVYKPLR